MNKSEKAVKKLVEDIQSGKRVTPLKAIRGRCLDCCCFQSEEVRLCSAKDCPLYMFRLGINQTGRSRTRTPSKKPLIGQLEA